MAVAAIRISQTALQNALRQGGKLPVLLQPLASAATRECKAVAGERTQRHTGQLEAGYTSQVVPVGGGPIIAKIRTINPVKHAIFIEAGTRPHRIPTSGETILAFTVRGQRIVMFGHVQHPGTKPYNVIRDALRRVVLRKAF